MSLADPEGLRALVPRGAEVALRTDRADVVTQALATLDGWAAIVHLLPGGVADPCDSGQVAALPDGAGTVSVAAGDDAASVETTEWVLYTSGSTGEPKAIRHSLASLARTVVDTPEARSLTWGLLYDPNRMAGVQVLLQGLRTGATVVAPPPSETLRARVEQLIDAGVDALSATPTTWRRILSVPDVGRWPLRRITLGGEIADQQVLDALAARFPDARIAHIFASTETGAAFAVRDGRAGFPAAYLDDAPGGIALRIRDGILEVQSPGSSVAGPDGFASTGDLVELDGDRVLFRGRASGVVNVGGDNVWPEEVEALLRSHPDVVEAVVSSTPNPLAGNVLLARVVVDEHADPTGTRKALRRWVRDRAPSSHVPARVEVVADLVDATTGKAQR